MSTRDYISEIIEIRGRRSSNFSDSELFSRLSSLETAFKKAPKDNLELLKYFPIALVATIEGCFRVMIAELIDSNESFLTNSEQLLKNHKISVNLLKAFQGKQISVGEFISHVVSINKLPDIDSLLSTVTGRKFLKELKNHRSRWDIEILKKEDIPILLNAKEIYKDITRTFELRHIFCHETATKVEFDYEEIQKCFLSVTLFLKATTDYVGDVMYPNTPLTQSDINAESGRELYEKMQEIKNTQEQLIKKLKYEPERIILLKSAHEIWLTYQDEFSRFSADIAKGGSMWPMLCDTASYGLAEDYLKTLKNELKIAES